MTGSPKHELIEQLGLEHALAALKTPALETSWPALCALAVRRMTSHGRFSEWAQTISKLPMSAPASTRIDTDVPQVVGGGHDVEQVLRDLGPWKKGPFEIYGTRIDAEWRSQLKWDRVMDVASPLPGKRVLDVGTGNGYFLLRAAGAGAAFTLGLEPSVHFASQFLAINRCFQNKRVALLPATSEQFVQDCAAFDTVLSMGVLYHRRSPLDHIAQLRSFLRSGGELILETIIVDGAEGHTLVPEGRYAQMRNVWFLPSVATLRAWLGRMGFRNIESSAPVVTTPAEQRTTSWTNQPSLSDFLDPDDSSLTIEGHPAPKRVIFTAKAP